MSAPYYADDLVTLYHGDCREVTEWLGADVLVTDPPYGRGWKQGVIPGHTENRDSATGIANDHSTDARDECLSLWGGDRLAIVFGDLMLAPPKGNRLTCAYHKTARNAGLRGAMGGVRRDLEAIYLVGPWPSGIGGRSSIFATTQRMSGATGLVARCGGHPHTKPSDVLTPLIDMTSGVVADPFAGSGSTLATAKQLGRKAIGIELSERYCEIAAKRLAQGVLDLTGAQS